jgi:hypothetical protein
VGPSAATRSLALVIAMRSASRLFIMCAVAFVRVSISLFSQLFIAVRRTS